MFKRKSPFSNETVNAEEAAEFLGFKSKLRFLQKVRSGDIPGAKIGREWVFLKEDIVNYLRNHYTTKLTETRNVWHSTKEINSTGLNSQSQIKNQDVLLQCVNLRKKLREKAHNDMKIKEDKKLESSSSTVINQRKLG